MTNTPEKWGGLHKYFDEYGVMLLLWPVFLPIFIYLWVGTIIIKRLNK